MNVSEMTTKQLVEEYNESTGKNIKKFADRTKAEAAVQRIRDSFIQGKNKMTENEEQKQSLLDVIAEDEAETSKRDNLLPPESAQLTL